MRPPASCFLAAALAQQRWPAAPAPSRAVPRRILLIRLNRLGDLICALPVYRSLEQTFPEAEIDWLLSSQNSVLAPYLRPRGHIFTFRKSIGRFFINRPLLRSLQARRYDIAIALKGGYDALLAWISLASDASERRGYVPNTEPFLAFAFNKQFPLPPTHSHQVEKGLGLVQDLMTQKSDDTSLEISAKTREKISHRLANSGVSVPFVVFQISSTKRAFCQWPAEHFAVLGKQFVERGLHVCINALAADQKQAGRLAHEIGSGASIISFAEMDEYLGFLERALIVIGADGGGIHLAAAMGAHTVAFFAESSPEKWRPWRGDHIEFYTANRDVREIAPAKVWEEITRKRWF